MTTLRQKIRHVFMYVAAAGAAVTGTAVHAQDNPVNAEANAETPDRNSDGTYVHNGIVFRPGTGSATPQQTPDTTQTTGTQTPVTQAPVQTNLPTTSQIAYTQTGTFRYPSAPTRVGDYERDLPLQRCPVRLNDRYSNATDVLRYMAQPSLTPNVVSPDMSERQITLAQQHLQKLGFDISDDGEQGPATTRAVMEFQMFWGPITNTMDINGVIDENTFRHMEYYARMAERDARTYDIPIEAVGSIRLTQLRTGESFEFLSDLFRQESTFRVGVRARTSSATGLGQHIDRTWLKNVYYAGCKYGLDDYADQIRIRRSGSDAADIEFSGTSRQDRFLMNLRRNPRFSALMSAENSQYEVGLIQHWTGMTLDQDWQKYSVHFFGVEAAYFFYDRYQSSPNASAAARLPRQARANRAIFYTGGRARSYQEVGTWFQGKFGTGRYRERYQVAAYRPPSDVRVGYAGQTRDENVTPTTQQSNTPPPPPPSPGS